MTAKTASPPRQRRKEARPQELLGAALELFVEKGFAATRSEEVAARAGVAKGTLYLYYPSKEDLLRAVVRENLSALIAEGATIAGSFEGTTQDLLALLMTTWWERVGNTQASGIFKIIITEMGNFPDFARFYMEEVIEPGHDLFSRVLERGIASGELRPVNVLDAVHVLIFPMLMMCLHKHSLGACTDMSHMMDPTSFIQTHVDVVVRGLLVRADEPAATAPARKRR
ncbi:MAG TPA: TetR/AcrR family transcriptional regulator [Albitalea sp.]|uniref:TetR/AcrR family transcriptional regulator n=1 Tax=Piscinibacter sp. TaxID=1903157 RepID=UPI002ED2112A